MRQFPSRDVAAQADWVELSLIVTGNLRLGKSQLRERIEESAPDLNEAEIEIAVGEIFTEVRRRQRAGGGLYPFVRDRTAISRRGLDDNLESLYAYLALNSAEPGFRKPVTGFTSGRVFEELVEVALKRWTGGEAIVFARAGPSDETGIRAAIKRLGSRLSVETHPSRARRARNDHGLDVAAWRAFPDHRAGYPVLLCQCTVGWGLTRKAREVEKSEWGKLLDIREGAFAAALAIPHVLIPDYPHWRELRYATDLIVDRLRLLVLLDGTSQPWLPLVPHATALKTGLATWANGGS